MAKSGNRIHGTLHARRVSFVGTKGFLLDLINENGWTLERSDVIDAGEWNERRVWSAHKDGVEVKLGSTLGRMNWADATDTFLCKGLGWSAHELSNAKLHWG